MSDTHWLVCHDMTNLDHASPRYISVAAYRDATSARAKARKEKAGEGAAIKLVLWSGEEPEQGVAIRGDDERIEQVRSA